ncbi:MAG: hypothetical protein EU544_00995 [Promethearchaeota archaeon]|nr:MAG: hypothetical protein EU544_00995 [Candidatus Lokiarchaeota archaeon]
MENETSKNNEKNKISVGLIISHDDLVQSPIFPEEVKQEISVTDYYLLIYISREDVVKVSCFPTDTKNIKKILIKLKEFSPDLVKGISNVLKDLNLSKDILHTTGLCYELENCFYETYLVGNELDSEDQIQKIKEEFTAVAKVINVIVEDIPSL